MTQLTLQGVTRRFGVLTAVDAVDLSLRVGECVGLIGPNGAGKSTLLALMVGDLRPTSGQISLNDTVVTRLPVPARVRAGIARAAQIPQIFDRLTVSESVRLPALYGAGLSDTQARAEAAIVLERCGLADKAQAYASALGLLDRKRLELAKALAARPRILLLDEIAAGLTEPEVEEMVVLVKSLRDDRAILWVEHIPMALREACERLIVMERGVKTLDGPFAQVWSDPGLQAVYMGVPGDAAA
ncbi:ABC transporter ATP-binding protein [Pararhodobacter zhoushanensis]|uniref:ATP-binding cassette domain-containing protein n=1 Tax=Pararhodobacter zhoushanensis TaxID=2479545 RepID=A0ABT3H522_9RHOB|nr:ATP-binding cassette domain-containing protein [Pararhodobacter zhoushanensis]MCW1934904.1 ATP-binding cassette domain-containing protein [Pararhodobacter zhoushanensis]